MRPPAESPVDFVAEADAEELEAALVVVESAVLVAGAVVMLAYEVKAPFALLVTVKYCEAMLEGISTEEELAGTADAVAAASEVTMEE